MSWEEDYYKDYANGIWDNYATLQWSGITFSWEDWLMNTTIFTPDTTPSTNWRMDRRTILGAKIINDLQMFNDPESTFGGDDFEMNEDA